MREKITHYQTDRFWTLSSAKYSTAPSITTQPIIHENESHCLLNICVSYVYNSMIHSFCDMLCKYNYDSSYLYMSVVVVTVSPMTVHHVRYIKLILT